MVVGPSLGKNEAAVLYTIKRVGMHLGEHELHQMMVIISSASGAFPYNFHPQLWEDIDERYKTGWGSLPFSTELHGDVELLIRKGYLVRSPENPLVLVYNGHQLRLFPWL